MGMIGLAINAVALAVLFGVLVYVIVTARTRVRWVDEVTENSRRREAERKARELLHRVHTKACAFCCKGEHQVARLHAGPTVSICSECVDLGNEYLREHPDFLQPPLS